jgi:hypothetical protein
MEKLNLSNLLGSSQNTLTLYGWRYTIKLWTATSLGESVLCYTVTMSTNQQIWQDWAHNLHRWGLAEWTASILDAAGPLTLIAAQLVYMAEPLVNKAMPEERLQALAELLEDANQAHSFTTYLREGDPR